MQVEKLSLPGVMKLTLDLYADSRGSFVESWQAERYAALGLPDFVQDNLVRSEANVLRGLHFQIQNPQAKLIQVLAGEVVDVIADIDPKSKYYGQYDLVNLTSDGATQLYVPPGYAHGYYVLSSFALVSYKCSQYYFPHDQGGVRWNDPVLAVKWPLKKAPLVLPRDQAWPLLPVSGSRC